MAHYLHPSKYNRLCITQFSTTTTQVAPPFSVDSWKKTVVPGASHMGQPFVLDQANFQDTAAKKEHGRQNHLQHKIRGWFVDIGGRCFPWWIVCLKMQYLFHLSIWHLLFLWRELHFKGCYSTNLHYMWCFGASNRLPKLTSHHLECSVKVVPEFSDFQIPQSSTAISLP